MRYIAIIAILLLSSCSVLKHKTHSSDRVQKETATTTDSNGTSTQTWTNTTTTTEDAPDSLKVPGSVLVTDDDCSASPDSSQPDSATLAETDKIKLQRITAPGKKPKLKVTVKDQTIPVNKNKTTTSTTTGTGTNNTVLKKTASSKENSSHDETAKNKEAHLPWYVWAIGLVLLLVIVRLLWRWIAPWMGWLRGKKPDDTETHFT